MKEVAHGIDVYYGNKGENQNIVVFSNNSQMIYKTGDMLLELLDPKVIYMLNQKVTNMIKYFPEYKMELDYESLKNGFMWLCGTIEEDDAPVATELFQSTFSKVIKSVADQGGIYSSVGDFLETCNEEYQLEVAEYVFFAGAIAMKNSDMASEIEKKAYDMFSSLSAERELLCSSKRRYINGTASRRKVYKITDFWDLLNMEVGRLDKERKKIKICENCGKIFVPVGRSDTIYCGLTSPQRVDKKCYEIGAQMKRKRLRSESGDEHEYHNTTCKLYNMVRRMKEKNDPEDLINWYKKHIEIEVQKYTEKRKGVSK